MPGVFGSTERAMVIGPFIPQKKLPTNVGLANMLQQKALAAASVPDFPQNCGKPCGFYG